MTVNMIDEYVLAPSHHNEFIIQNHHNAFIIETVIPLVFYLLFL